MENITDSFTKQKIANAIAWIDALKANEYKQGTDKLGNAESGYCCLGVGCVVTGVDFIYLDTKSGEFREKVELNSDVGRLKCGSPAFDTLPEVVYTSLMDLNDIARLPFPEIARHIIERADALFFADVAKGITAHYTQA